MAGATGQYKQVPYTMTARVPVVENEKHDARSVENATSQQPAKTGGRQSAEYGTEGKQT